MNDLTDFMHGVSWHLKNNNLIPFRQMVNDQNVNYESVSEKWTPLHFACNARYNITDNAEFVYYLIRECNATAHITDDRSVNKPIHLAVIDFDCRRSNPVCLRVLLQFGANVDCLNGYNETPLERLFRLSEVPNAEIIWLLLEYGACLKTALDETFKCSHKASIALAKTMAMGRTIARYAALLVVGIRRLNRSDVLSSNNMDIARLLGQLVWDSRRHYTEWNYSNETRKRTKAPAEPTEPTEPTSTEKQPK